MLRQANAQQADDILRLQADSLQLQAVVAENTRLQSEITILHKVSSTEKGYANDGNALGAMHRSAKVTTQAHIQERLEPFMACHRRFRGMS